VNAAGPTWTDIVGAVNGSLTFVALVAGGTVAYVRFLRGRVLHASCDLELTAALVGVGDETAIQVTATATNAGSYRLRFPAGTRQVVTACQADRAMWNDARRFGGETLWSAGVFYQQELLTTEGERDGDFYLEPGQRLVRCLLIPTPGPAGSGLAYYLSMYVEARPQFVKALRPKQDWSTELTLAKGV
jgi:hypothetical protein